LNPAYRQRLTLLLSAVLTLLLEPLAAAAGSDAAIYRGSVEVVPNNGRSCYPDMRATHEVELFLSGHEESGPAYLVLTPGYAYALDRAAEREPNSGRMEFVRPPIHHEKSPYFAPRAASVTRTDSGFRLAIDWAPLEDCVAESAAFVLARTSADAERQLRFWQRRDQLLVEGETARKARQPFESERAARELFEMLVAERGLLSPETMAAARGLASFGAAAGRAQSAVEPARRAHEAARAAAPYSSRLVQMATNLLAGALSDAGAFRESLENFRRGFDERETFVDRLHVDQLDALVWMSYLHDRLDEPTAALEIAQEALKRDTEFYGRGSEKSAESALFVFARQMRLGRPLAALELAEYSYESRLKLHGPDAVPTLTSLNAVAVVNSSWLQRPEVAMPLFERIRTALVPMADSGDQRARDQLSTVTFNLANTQRRVGLRQQALETAKEAHRLYLEESRPTDSRRYSPAILMVALYSDLGLAAEAVKQGEALLADIEKHLPGNLGLRVVVLDVLAQANARAGNPQAALRMWSEAHALALKSYPPTGLPRLMMLRPYADLLEREGLLTDAVARRRELVDGVEALMLQAAALGDTRADAFSAFAESYRRLTHSWVGLGNLEEALRIAQRTKARLLLETVALRGAIDVVDFDPADREQLRTLDAARAAAERKVLSADLAGFAMAEIERNRAVREFNAQVEQLRTKSPKFAALTHVEPADSATSRAMLEPGSIFIETIVGNQQTILFLLARDRPLSAHVVPTPTRLAAVIEAYRIALLSSAARAGTGVWRLEDGSFAASVQRPADAVERVEQHSEIGTWLSRHLLTPVESELRPYSRWIIAPDSAIAHLPFDALPWNGKPLVEQVVLTTTQSLSVYSLGRRLGGATPMSIGPRQRWLGLGAPHYGALNKSLQSARSVDRVELATRAPQRDASLRSQYAPLPYAMSELKAVARMFNLPTLIVGADATESRLRALDRSGELSRFDVLHFAAHATVNPQRAALSALVLGSSSDSPDDDGLLTAAEMTQLHLNSQLVVLSACETALGQRVSGEGVLGLPYALFIAGNRNALLTLWPVADEATSRFIRAFFARVVRGESMPAALTATKRDFAAGKHGQAERAPFYWAPFLLVGPG